MSRLRAPHRAGIRSGSLRTWALPLLAVTATSCSPAGQESGEVFLDGLFDEWSDAVAIVDDAPDAPRSAIDFGSLYGLDDPAWLYLSVELGHEVNAQALEGTLELLFDTDGEGATGGVQHGMDGVDLVLELSQIETPVVPGRGSGFALRTVDSEGLRGPAARYALGVTAAPSWAASRIELRISRGGTEALPSLGPELRLKAAYVLAGALEDETEVGSYTFRTPPGSAATPSVAERLRKSEGSLRVAQWNVATQSFVRNADGFARILGALEPDVVLLDEVPENITPEGVSDFFALDPLSTLGSWRFVLGESDGPQRTIVAARNREVQPIQSMSRVRYPDGALDALRELTPVEFHRLLDLEEERDISSTAASVRVGGTNVLFVPVDLQSRGWAGNPHDQLRVLQARTVRDHVRAVLAEQPTPVVIGGDLNLVGSRDPLDFLIDGLDTDGSDLTPVDAARLGERTYTTWRNPRDVFAPGRLDFVLVPDAGSVVTNSFVFATEDLDPATLEQLGLEPDLSVTISDHLVVVADLRFR